VKGLSATRITIAAHALGAASVVLFATGRLVAAALVFQMSFFLDCLDGKVARATGTGSRWGAFVDLAGDTILLGAAYAALGFRMIQDDVSGAWMILVLLPAFTAAVWLHLYRRLALGETDRSAMPAEHPGKVWSFRRFYPYPGSVEIETLVLFLFPLAMPGDWFMYVAGIATAFYLVSGADSVRRTRRLLARLTT
jgi:phosphatidylglycerophosphate synthase